MSITGKRLTLRESPLWEGVNEVIQVTYAIANKRLYPFDLGYKPPVPLRILPQSSAPAEEDEEDEEIRLYSDNSVLARLLGDEWTARINDTFARTLAGKWEEADKAAVSALWSARFVVWHHHKGGRPLALPSRAIELAVEHRSAVWEDECPQCRYLQPVLKKTVGWGANEHEEFTYLTADCLNCGASMGHPEPEPSPPSIVPQPVAIARPAPVAVQAPAPKPEPSPAQLARAREKETAAASAEQQRRDAAKDAAAEALVLRLEAQGREESRRNRALLDGMRKENTRRPGRSVVPARRF